MKNYLTRFTEGSAESRKVFGKFLSGVPSKPTKAVWAAPVIFENPLDDEPSKPTKALAVFENSPVGGTTKPTKPPFEGFVGAGVEHFSNIEAITGVEHGPLPYLTEGSELRIPFNTLPRFRWWQAGQPIWTTLAELGAPLETWRRHAANRGEFLFSPKHPEWCGGEAQTGDGFAFCVECGGYAEIQQSK
ncbi:MAG: hypothetical protein ACKVZH_01020 [Blastocatellia bacterium]